MKSEVRFIGPSWKAQITVGFFVTVIIIFLATVYRLEVGLILLSIAGGLGTITLFFAVNRVLTVGHRRQLNRLEIEHRFQELRIITATADKAELEAHVLSFPKAHRIVTLDNSRVKIIDAPGDGQPLLPETVVDTEPLDLLTVFTQLTQSYAIIGGQQTGKTYQARHIAAYWLGRGFQPLVIGPKWDRGEWAGCIRLGGNGDMAEVSRGITIIRQIVEKRHSDQRGHKEHKTLPVFFDDWTPIVDAVDNARALVLEATTLYASVNVILYFILHSDTANAWGVDRKGAALKDNFVKLFIEPHYDSAGLIVRHRTRGYVRFAGESVDRPVKLLTGPIASGGEPVSDEYINLEVEPTPTEAAILNLHEQGESFNEIARQVYGSTGGKQTELIKQVLSKFS